MAEERSLEQIQELGGPPRPPTDEPGEPAGRGKRPAGRMPRRLVPLGLACLVGVTAATIGRVRAVDEVTACASPHVTRSAVVPVIVGLPFVFVCVAAALTAGRRDVFGKPVRALVQLDRLWVAVLITLAYLGLALVIQEFPKGYGGCG